MDRPRGIRKVDRPGEDEKAITLITTLGEDLSKDDGVREEGSVVRPSESDDETSVPESDGKKWDKKKWDKKKWEKEWEEKWEKEWEETREKREKRTRA